MEPFLQGHYINCFSSYGEANGRWRTLLNLYDYHSLGTACYYLFTTFLLSSGCAAFLHLTCNVAVTLCRGSQFDNVEVLRPTITRPGRPGYLVITPNYLQSVDSGDVHIR